jgi:hypothetical protein
MSVARGTKYLEETRVRERESQRARTEARQVQLKLTELEARITDLEGLRDGFAGKATARCLPVTSACLGTSLLLLLFVVFYSYVFASSFRAPTLNAQQIGWE